MSATDRLTRPLIRKNGELQQASWAEAMDLIVAKAQSIRKKLTAHGIAFYTSGQLFLEEYYALALVGKAGLNTLHMFASTPSPVAIRPMLTGKGMETLVSARQQQLPRCANRLGLMANRVHTLISTTRIASSWLGIIWLLHKLFCGRGS